MSPICTTRSNPISHWSRISSRCEPPFRLDLGPLWEYRELLYFLVWRDLKVRYKQTALGVAWAIIQPLSACSSSP